MRDMLPAARVVRDALPDPKPAPLSPAQQFDVELAAFSRGARRRNARIFAIAVGVCILLGAIFATVAIFGRMVHDPGYTTSWVLR